MADESLEALRAEQAEVGEAMAAVSHALYRVNEAAERLRSARDLGTLDTWFGGGLFTSMLKHDRLDGADQAMRSVDLALEAVRKELADVGVDAAVGGLGITPLHRTLDIWFDNLISDLGTQRRVKDAGQRVAGLGSVLTRVQSQLGRRDQDLATRISALETET